MTIERILPAETEWNGVPYVGCAVTIPVGSDSYPGTVVWVSEETISHEYTDRKTGKKFTVQIPRRIRIADCGVRGVEGHSNAFTENQRYVYYDTETQRDPRFGSTYSYRPRKKNYVAVGTPWRSSAAQAPGFGYRRYYRDPSF